MKYYDIIDKVAKLLNMPYDVVLKTYSAYWKYIKHSMLSIDLKDDIPEDLYANLRTSINIPSLGKFTCTYDRYLRMKKQYNYIKNRKHDKS